MAEYIVECYPKGHEQFDKPIYDDLHTFYRLSCKVVPREVGIE